MPTAQEEPKGDLVIRTIAMPKDTNANGDIFGGWLVSQMDLGAGVMAKKQCRSRTVTVAIDKMTFLRPVHVGDILCCYAELLKIGNTSMTIRLQAWALPQETAIRAKVTEGIFTFVAVDSHGQPIPVKRD